MSSDPVHTRLASSAVVIPVLVCWLIAVVAGLGWMAVYANDPGPAGAPPHTWPAGSTIARTPGRPTLLVFAHPQCGCTRASVAELDRLIAAVNGRADVRLIMFRPDGEPDAWARTELWSAAASIPGVTPMIDVGGREAEDFNVLVSGHTLLYDANARLAFSGGITAARAHEGDNAGRAALTSLLVNGSASIATTPVFGCFLRQGGVAQ